MMTFAVYTGCQEDLEKVFQSHWSNANGLRFARCTACAHGREPWKSLDWVPDYAHDAATIRDDRPKDYWM